MKAAELMKKSRPDPLPDAAAGEGQRTLAALKKNGDGLMNVIIQSHGRRESPDAGISERRSLPTDAGNRPDALL
jgi:hypothetical protein